MLGNFDEEDAVYGKGREYGKHDRIKKFYGKPKLDQSIPQEVQSKGGRLLITSR